MFLVAVTAVREIGDRSCANQFCDFHDAFHDGSRGFVSKLAQDAIERHAVVAGIFILVYKLDFSVLSQWPNQLYNLLFLQILVR